MKVLDLFSGIGGFSLGLERAGYETAAFCEIDKACHKVLRKHWPTTPIYEDVKKLTAFDFEQGEIDVICGGFPCQDISVAGNKLGLQGARSGLWFEYKRLIEEIKPKYVIIENVANLRSKGLTTVLQDLWEIGYDAEWNIISACGIGAVHRRERVWIIAYPRGPKHGHKDHKYDENCPHCKRWKTFPNSDGSQRPGNGSSSGIDPKLDGLGDFSSETITPDAYDLRLGSPTSSQEEKQKWRAEAASRFRDLFGQILSIEPSIRRVDDGFPIRLDKGRRERVKQLGNSVLPQIPQLHGEAINLYEFLRSEL